MPYQFLRLSPTARRNGYAPGKTILFSARRNGYAVIRHPLRHARLRLATGVLSGRPLRLSCPRRNGYAFPRDPPPVSPGRPASMGTLRRNRYARDGYRPCLIPRARRNGYASYMHPGQQRRAASRASVDNPVGSGSYPRRNRFSRGAESGTVLRRIGFAATQNRVRTPAETGSLTRVFRM